MGVPKVYTPEDYQRIADELIAWAKEPESCHLAEFICVIKNKSAGWLNSICDDSQVVKDAKEQAKLILAAKYTKNGLTEKWNSGLVQRLTPLYDPDLRAMILESQRAARQEREEGTVNVNIRSFLNCDESQ